MSPAVFVARAPALDGGRGHTRPVLVLGTARWTMPGSLSERLWSWICCHVAQNRAARGPQSPSGPLSAVAEDSRIPLTQDPSEPSARPAPAPALVPAGRKRLGQAAPRWGPGCRGPGACTLCWRRLLSQTPAWVGDVSAQDPPLLPDPTSFLWALAEG